jgi:hypothetical protein
VPEVKTPKATSTTPVSNKYRIDDVSTMTVVTNTANADVYTIKLIGGAERTVEVPQGATTAERNKAFRDSGFSGSVKLLFGKLVVTAS